MSAEARRTAVAFDALVTTLTDARAEVDALAERAAHMREAVAGGGDLSALVVTEQRPLVITRMTELLDRLTDAGGGGTPRRGTPAARRRAQPRADRAAVRRHSPAGRCSAAASA